MLSSRERAEAAIQIRRDAAGRTTVCLVHPDGKRGDILWSYHHPEDATGTAEQYRGYLVAHLDAHAAEAVADLRPVATEMLILKGDTAIRAAVLMEREACARLAEQADGSASRQTAGMIVAAIRARGLPETS